MESSFNQVTKLLGVSWEAVANIVIDVVGDVLDESRFEGLARLRADEISYRKGHRYLTVVVRVQANVSHRVRVNV